MTNEQETKVGVIDQPHSTEISINAKGMWSGCVKCYGITSEDAFQSALVKAVELERIIHTKNDARQA